MLSTRDFEADGRSVDPARIKATLAKASYLFLSYSHSDRRIARRVYAALLKLRRGRPSATVYFDEQALEPGDIVSPPMVDAAILKSEILVVLCGRDTARSKEVAREIELSLTAGLRVLPITLHPKVMMPSRLDWTVQAVALDRLFPFRRLQRLLQISIATSLLLTIGVAIVLEAALREQVASDTDRRWREGIAVRAASMAGRGDLDQALVLAIAAYPDAAGIEVPASTPKWLVSRFLDTVLASRVDLMGQDAQLLPPIFVGDSDVIVRPRRPNSNLIALRCWQKPGYCDWGPVAWSRNERYAAISEKDGHLVLLDLDQTDPGSSDGYVEGRVDGSKISGKFAVIDIELGRDVPTTPGASRSSVAWRPHRGMVDVKFYPCESTVSQDPAPRPCRITGLSFVEDMLVLAFQDGAIFGVNLDGSIRWRAAQKNCQPQEESRNLANCAVRAMQTVGPEVLGSVDNGAAVRISAEGRVTEVRSEMNFEGDYTNGTGVLNGWHRSDYCLDPYGLEKPDDINQCEASQSWVEGQFYSVLDRGGRLRRWKALPERLAFQYTASDNRAETDELGEPLFFGGELEIGSGATVATDRWMARLADDVVVVRVDHGSGYSLAVYARSTRRLLRLLEGQSMFQHNGLFFAVTDLGVIGVDTKKWPNFAALPPYEAKRIFCALVQRDPQVRRRVTASLIAVGSLLIGRQYPCGLRS